MKKSIPDIYVNAFTFVVWGVAYSHNHILANKAVLLFSVLGNPDPLGLSGKTTPKGSEEGLQQERNNKKSSWRFDNGV
uniref:Rhomboid domain-containing protein n=1 Tax=Steinernema glaseri TaxID=37863 RepID=A0A1I7XZA5_9BILA